MLILLFQTGYFSTFTLRYFKLERHIFDLFNLAIVRDKLKKNINFK